jgi:hypothetical protein
MKAFKPQGRTQRHAQKPNNINECHIFAYFLSTYRIQQEQYTLTTSSIPTRGYVVAVG